MLLLYLEFIIPYFIFFAQEFFVELGELYSLVYTSLKRLTDTYQSLGVGGVKMHKNTDCS